MNKAALNLYIQSGHTAGCDLLSVFALYVLYVLYTATAANMTEHLQRSLFGPETQILQSNVMSTIQFSSVHVSLHKLPPGTHF